MALPSQSQSVFCSHLCTHLHKTQQYYHRSLKNGLAGDLISVFTKILYFCYGVNDSKFSDFDIIYTLDVNMLICLYGSAAIQWMGKVLSEANSDSAVSS